jgi:ferredoxin|tara:strand:+ start:1068 stop:2660 length:1593 start_codon:yes stop_codon:yes gene_type:complete
VKLTIDNQELELDESTTLYHAAKQVGIDIPVMCYKEGHDYFTSCMICEVKDKTSGNVYPACSAPVVDGMEIDTQCEEIRERRKATLELLLSEHIGDCEAPCQRLCAIHSEVPRMIREIKDNRMDDAIATIRRDMALPAILERFCNAPCEKGCRRGVHDETVSIRHLTRYAAEWDLRREAPYIPPAKKVTGKAVAIIGSGVTGLATAYYLALAGHAPTVFEQHDKPGGRLLTEHDEEQLPAWVLEGELRVLRGMGVEFKTGVALGRDISLAQLGEQFGAVSLALGQAEPAALEALGLEVTDKGLKLDPKTRQTSVKGVFGGGSVVKLQPAMLKLVQGAKGVAKCIGQFLDGQPITGIVEMYNHTMGRLQEGEIDIFVSGASPIPQVKPENLEVNGFKEAEAEDESTRCMHCDCRAKDNCDLRIYSDAYGAKQAEFKGETRAKHEHINQNAGAVYEPGKCIKCGLCVRVTKDEGEEFGFTFVGRGFEVKPGISLNQTLDRGLQKVAEKVIEACPTGALAENEKYQPELIGTD